ncbi:MAG TPA: hypothetical protein VF184_13420 [Phycisphaeraceae bacterium]
MSRQPLVWMGIAGMMVGLVGCVASRPPRVTIKPDYSYVQAQPSLSVGEIWPVKPAASAVQVAELPPLPPAPGFEQTP